MTRHKLENIFFQKNFVLGTYCLGTYYLGTYYLGTYYSGTYYLGTYYLGLWFTHWDLFLHLKVTVNVITSDTPLLEWHLFDSQ